MKYVYNTLYGRFVKLFYILFIDVSMGRFTQGAGKSEGEK